MNPYEIACDEFHSTDQGETWSEFLTDHFRDPNSWILSTPAMFVIARKIDEETLAVEAVSGVLADLLEFIPDTVKKLEFQRRNDRVHRVKVEDLRSRQSFIGRK